MSGLKTFPRKRFLVKKFISPMTSLKTPVIEINRTYRKSLKFTFMISLLVFVVLFQAIPKKMQLGSGVPDAEQIDLIAEDITPRTQQLTQVQPPPRPAMPIPIDDDEIPEDLTIAETELVFDELPPAPPPPSESTEDGYRFIPFDSPPEPIGGLASLQKYIQYPEIARQAGVESRVVVGILVDEKGNCVKTIILKSSETKVGFEDAAQYAVSKLKWIPEKQRDVPVQVWTSIVVRFKLTKT